MVNCHGIGSAPLNAVYDENRETWYANALAVCGQNGAEVGASFGCCGVNLDETPWGIFVTSSDTWFGTQSGGGEAKRVTTCSHPPSPPPSPLNPPPPPIPSASFKTIVDECLAEAGAEVTGECTAWESDKTYGTMPNWDTYLVTNMYAAFSNKRSFNGDISKWDTSQVTDMTYTFYRAWALNQDIGSWNTKKVTRMVWTFYLARRFNQDIGRWDTSQVTAMDHMFGHAQAFNHDISSWTGTAATTLQFGMLWGATAFQSKFACTEAIRGPPSSCVLKS